MVEIETVVLEEPKLKIDISISIITQRSITEERTNTVIAGCQESIKRCITETTKSASIKQQ